VAFANQRKTKRTSEADLQGVTSRGERKLGIIAGAGPFPGYVISRCEAGEIPYFVLALKGFADPDAVAQAPHGWSRLGGGGRSLRLMREAGVDDIAVIGNIRRPPLLSFWPDLVMLGAMMRIGWRALRGGDDALIKAIIPEVEGRGFTVIAIQDLLPELLAGEGLFGRCQPDQLARTDIDIGVEAAREVGRRDVGQGAVVEGGRVLAREDAKGTDVMLARVATMPERNGPGGVLIKVLKPGQQRKVDLPTIGVRTVEAAASAGLRGIAIEAGSAIVVDREAVAEAADEAGLFVIGIKVGQA